MITHNHDAYFCVCQEASAAHTLCLKRQSAVISVDNMAFEKHRAVLINGGQCAIRERCQHGRCFGVHVHDAARMRAQSMNRTMQTPSRGVGGLGALHNRGIVGVEEYEIGGCNTPKMNLVGVH